jgi:hypothetical protein
MSAFDPKRTSPLACYLFGLAAHKHVVKKRDSDRVLVIKRNYYLDEPTLTIRLPFIQNLFCGDNCVPASRESSFAVPQMRQAAA